MGSAIVCYIYLSVFKVSNLCLTLKITLPTTFQISGSLVPSPPIFTDELLAFFTHFFFFIGSETGISYRTAISDGTVEYKSCDCIVSRKSIIYLKLALSYFYLLKYVCTCSYVVINIFPVDIVRVCG